MVLRVGLDERHSLYQVVNWNTTGNSPYIIVFVGIWEIYLLLCLSVFGRY